MRLIDADKVLERLEKWNTSDETDRALYNFAIKRIFEQPVVYDVEKVVEELKEWSMSADIKLAEGIFEKHNIIALKNAIKIVKGGEIR